MATPPLLHLHTGTHAYTYTHKYTHTHTPIPFGRATDGGGRPICCDSAGGHAAARASAQLSSSFLLSNGTQGKGKWRARRRRRRRPWWRLRPTAQPPVRRWPHLRHRRRRRCGANAPSGWNAAKSCEPTPTPRRTPRWPTLPTTSAMVSSSATCSLDSSPTRSTSKTSASGPRWHR